MDLAGLRRLFSSEGQAALQAAEALAPREADYLAHFTRLSSRYAPELAQAALETAILRAEAGAKFPFAAQMYFTRQALEQASPFEVSSYRAQRFAGAERLIDLGCSIGADTLALARLAPTIGLDIDPLRMTIARANLQALGLGERATFLQADLTSGLPLAPEPGLGLFFDPARRVAGRRVYSVQEYQPPLEVISEWLPRYPALGVKISPGVDLDEIRPYPAEVEFISLHGELKEAALWFGPLQRAWRAAAVLPGAHCLVASSPHDLARLPLDEPRAYLYEPDAAVLRAGLVELLGARLGAAQLDEQIAYLTAERLVATPFARAWQVEDWLPFSLKRLRAALRERGVGRVVVKKRGSPLQPEALQRDLKLKGDQERVVFLTHLRGRPVAVICRPGPVLPD